MQILKLPHNCSAYYMHQVSELDDVKLQFQTLLTNDVKGKMPPGPRISAVLATMLQNHKKLVANFVAAGFEEIARYSSHNHGDRIVLVMFRRIRKTEFQTGVAIWPRRFKPVRKRNG